MECSNANWIRPQETLVDNWGGTVQFVEPSYNLSSALVNVRTPWGETDNWVEINKGSKKTYVDGTKTYEVHCVDVMEYQGSYYAKLYMCYEFIEKVNTVTSMSYDESASDLVLGGKIILPTALKDASGNVLEHYDVKIYKNGAYEWYVSGEWRYEHIITADEIGQTLRFQGKFEGTSGFNPSESSVVTVVVPGLKPTVMTIEADKDRVAIGETIIFTGTLKDDDGNIVVPNQTVWLQYKKADGTYADVLSGGYPVVASSDGSGNYYRPWEPSEFYLDYSTYAMAFKGSNGYTASRSPDINFDVTPICPIPTLTGIIKS